MNISHAQHQALGAIATTTASEQRPNATIRVDRWGMECANTTRRTFDALLRRELVQVYSHPTTGVPLACLTDGGRRALAKADNALRMEINEEMKNDPCTITPGEIQVIASMISRRGESLSMNMMEMETYDYLTRLRLRTRGYIDLENHNGEQFWQLNPQGYRAYKTYRERANAPAPNPETGNLVVSLAPLSLELTPEQVEAWREENGLASDDNVAMDILNFLHDNILHNEERWKVQQKR